MNPVTTVLANLKNEVDHLPLYMVPRYIDETKQVLEEMDGLAELDYEFHRRYLELLEFKLHPAAHIDHVARPAHPSISPLS